MSHQRAHGAMLDILAAMAEIEACTAGLDYAGYSSDAKTRRAVERLIEIISEASRRIPDHMKGRHPEIPWPEIRAIGNHIRHDYRRVDDLIIWKVATQSVQDLKTAILALIADLGTP